MGRSTQSRKFLATTSSLLSPAISTKEIHGRYVNHLGNLVLLSRGKNISAENYDFDLKKEKYFFANKLSTPFVLTNDLRDTKEYSEWTPVVIERRQKALMIALQQMWRL